MYKVLVADDNKEITELVGDILEKEGYELVKAYNGDEAIERFASDMSLVILAVMMPCKDGYEVCQLIRKQSHVPILFLSAKGTDFDKVVGLSSGGDDYMVKPFSTIELVARVRALIRRYNYIANPTQNRNVITISDVITMDINSRKVTKYGNEIILTRTEFGILELLAKNKGRVFSAEEIFKSVWKEKY